MSVTNLEVVDRALLALAVVSEGDSASAFEGATALNALNRMMAEWGQRDMDLHFPPQDELSETCPIPAWAENGVINNLAMNVAGELRVPATAIPSTTIDAARVGLRTIANTLMNKALEKADETHMSQGLGWWRGGNNILTDS